MPYVLDRARPLKVLVGIPDEADVAQPARQSLVVPRAKVAVDLLLGFGGKIASDSTQVGSIRVTCLVRHRVMNSVGDHVALFAKTYGIRPEKQTRNPDATEFEGTMRTIAVVPDRVVDHPDCHGCEESDQDVIDREEPNEEHQEQGEGGEMIGYMCCGEKPRRLLPECNRIDPLDPYFASTRLSRRDLSVSVRRLQQEALDPESFGPVLHGNGAATRAKERQPNRADVFLRSQWLISQPLHLQPPAGHLGNEEAVAFLQGGGELAGQPVNRTFG